MSVVIMLAWLWWGLCGFLAFAVGVWAVVVSLGPTGRFVLAVIVVTACGWWFERHLTANRRCANDFLTAWQDASSDYPQGIMYSHAPGEYLDYDRFGDVDPYLAQHWCLRWASHVWSAGKEVIHTAGSDAAIPADVYVASGRLHGSEHGVDFQANIRVWVAKDNVKIVQFRLEHIVFL